MFEIRVDVLKLYQIRLAASTQPMDVFVARTI